MRFGLMWRIRLMLTLWAIAGWSCFILSLVPELGINTHFLGFAGTSTAGRIGFFVFAILSSVGAAWIRARRGTT